MPFDSKTGPTWAGTGRVHPDCIGFSMRVWLQQAYGPEAALWRIWIAAAEATVAAEQVSGYRRELVLGDGLAKVWAIAAVALER
jgi:hypothetical protein